MGTVWNKEISSFVFWPPSGLARIWRRNHGFVLQNFIDDISETGNRWWHHNFNAGYFFGGSNVKQSPFRYESVRQLFYYSNVDFHSCDLILLWRIPDVLNWFSRDNPNVFGELVGEVYILQAISSLDSQGMDWLPKTHFKIQCGFISIHFKLWTSLES